MAIYVFAGKIIKRGSGFLSNGSTHTDVPGPAGAQTLSVSWDQPLISADGSALGTLSWFAIRYATTEPTLWDPLTTQYPYVKWINNGGATSGSVTNLAAGTYYATVIAEDSNGNQSLPGQYVAFTI